LVNRNYQLMNMQKIVLILTTLFTAATTLAQPDSAVTIIDAADRVFEKVEIEAAFPGGDNAWRRYLEQTLQADVPVNRGAPAGQYTVIVQFIVNKDGIITDVKALTNHGFGMEQEVIRVIKKGPKWNPAQQDGRYVRAYRKQPVTFWIEEEKKKKKKNKDE
jgi:protein TonB